MRAGAVQAGDVGLAVLGVDEVRYCSICVIALCNAFSSPAWSRFLMKLSLVPP